MPPSLRLALLLLLSFVLREAALAQSIQINRDNKTIAISTTDEATTVADIASITIGFEVSGADAQTTYADGGKLSQTILQALRKAGVDDKGIESSGQGLLKNTTFDDKESPSSARRSSMCSTNHGMYRLPLDPLPK